MTTETLSQPNHIEIRRELDALRRELLGWFLLPLLLVPILWLIYVTQRNWATDTVDLAVLQLVPAVFCILCLRKRHYNAACWLYVLTLAIGLALVMLSHPSMMTAAFGVLIIIVSYALLSAVASLVTVPLLWGLVNLAMSITLGGWPANLNLPIAALYLLVWGATWLFGRPLHTTGAWALNGWEQARRLLSETQQRRGEVYRALRGLEEATYRIERTNSELLIARQEADDLRQHKERFVATVSHELRGPLNLIVGFSRLMVMSPERYGQQLPEAYRADIATIYRNSQHLADMVDDILDLSQIEAQRLPLAKEWVDIDRIIDEGVSTVRPLAERKGLQVIEELPGDLPLVLGDRLRLRQVVLNLMTNALRFTEAGSISISTERVDDKVVVSVTDTGPGIPAAKIPLLFAEFQQAQTPGNEKTRADRGTGLGLAISRQLVELHGGHIWVESELHQGTAFRFSLPVIDAPPELDAAQSGEWRRAPRRSQRTLIVQAAPEVVRILARYLEGYQVIGVNETSEVVALTKELHPRAILVSAENAAPLRNALTQRNDVPILGCILPNQSGHPKLSNILAYLVKPIRPEPIEAIMHQIDVGHEITVLLVDDEPDAVRLIETLLTNLPRPYRILRAYDGRQALETMQRIVPDILFIDVVMPELDGWQTLARMRRDARLAEVPAVIISAQDRPGMSMSMGFPLSVYRNRPMTMTQSVKCLQALLDALDPEYQQLAGSSATDPAP